MVGARSDRTRLREGFSPPIFKGETMQESTKIWLYAKIPFKNDYANVINFETKEAMEDFFTKKNPHI